VDLTPYGSKPSVVLKTLPMVATAAYDWSGWGGLELTSADGGPRTDQFKLVYDNEVRIYENQSALPRAFAVPQVINVKDDKAALEALKQPGFNARNQVVIDGALSDSNKRL